MAVKAVPEGFHTITPYFVVTGAVGFLSFLEAAFGAVVLEKHEGPGGTIAHAVARIGTSPVMVGEAGPRAEARSACCYLYLEDVDGTYGKALEAGAESLMKPADQFYGDRNAGMTDAWGNQWWLATHLEDVEPEELQRRMVAARG